MDHTPGQRQFVDLDKYREYHMGKWAGGFVSAARWAVYYAPSPDHPLWAAGCRWLGRDPETGEHYGPPPEAPPNWQAHTEAPRRYGFHATLKPPFRLAAGATEAMLRQRLAALAVEHRRFRLPRLAVRPLGRFLALRPLQPVPAMADLAADCVRSLDDLRAPPTPTELSQQRAGGLTAHQSSLLEHWGYPYVLEEFRFHMTLTGPLSAAAAEDLMPRLTSRFATALEQPLPVEGIALFRQYRPDGYFRLVDRFSFGCSPGR